MKQVILDVETIKTFEDVGGYYPEKLGISFVGVIERDGFPEDGPAKETVHQLFENDLDQLWPVMESTDVVVGFNVIGFDLPALKPYYKGDINQFTPLDLMVRIKDSVGHRISLDAVAQETLGTQKTGHGLDAIKYYQSGQFEKLAKYCMKDVEITRDLYDYGRLHQKVKFLNRWNNLIEVDVNFNINPPASAGVQMALV